MFVEGSRITDTSVLPTVTAQPSHYLHDFPGEYEAFWRLRNDLRFIRNHYGIRVRVGRRTSSDLKNVSFERYTPTPVIANEDVASFRKILSKYPPEFIRFCGITQARIVEKLLLGKHRYWKGHRTVGGLASAKGLYMLPVMI